MRKVRRRAGAFRQLDHEKPLFVHVSLVAHGRRISPTASMRNQAVLPSHPGTDKHRQRQVSAREPVSAHMAETLAKRLTMSQPSRHTRYALAWSEIAILAYSVSGCCVSRRSASPSRCGEARHPRWPEGDPHRLFVSSPTRVAGVRHRPMAFSSRRSSLA